MKRTKIEYKNLNAKQKESYNFQKVSAVLADYGYTTILLADDWQGADFIAMHISGDEFMKVQLKGRLTFDKKYLGKDLMICFPEGDDWYLYPHDQVIEDLQKTNNFANSSSWIDKGWYSWNSPAPKAILESLEMFKL